MNSGASLRTKTTFFDELQDWSEIKLRLLTKYFDAYQRIRGGSHPRIYYVDGFAGAGEYGDGPTRREGSPVRLARLAQQIADTGKPYQLICINTEIDPDNCAKLERALAGSPPELVQVRCGAFADHLPAILGLIGSAPAVFFLDPFGVKPITLAQIEPLLRRQDTELLLNVNTRRLRLMAGFEDSTSKDRAAKLRLVSEVLGEDPAAASPEWLREWQRLGDPIHWETWAASTYAGRLLERSPHLRYALSYAVRETYRANPKYHLIFATRSDKPIPIMNDLICTEEDDLFSKTELVAKGGQLSFLGTLRASAHDDRLTAMAEEIHAYGVGHQGCTRPQIIRHFLLQNFGQLKQKHYRQVLGQLVQDGRATFANGRQNDHDPITFR